jgi:hypothetical protein
MGMLENLEGAWDEDFQFESKPMVETNSLGEKITYSNSPPATGSPNPKTHEVYLQHLEDIKQNRTRSYMLSIFRDDEDLARSILFFDNPIDAVAGYNKYQDYGFAKYRLTVNLHSPHGAKDTKVFVRNQAGDPTFVRKNYYDTINLLKSIRAKITPEAYEELVSGFASIFTEDNWRFSPDRFLKDLK